MHFLFLLLTVLQSAQPSAPAAPPTVRAGRFQLIIPQGWKILNDGPFVLVEHSSGASLRVDGIARPTNLRDYAHRQAERVMAPLGFAKLGEPQQFKNEHDEWIQYDIRGNRLSDRRRLLYRVLRRQSNFFEFVYEAPEDFFDALLTEAQTMANSVQAIIEAPPPRRTRR